MWSVCAKNRTLKKCTWCHSFARLRACRCISVSVSCPRRITQGAIFFTDTHTDTHTDHAQMNGLLYTYKIVYCTYKVAELLSCTYKIVNILDCTYNILQGRGLWCSGQSCLLGKSETAGSNPNLAFKFRSNKMFLPRSLVTI